MKHSILFFVLVFLIQSLKAQVETKFFPNGNALEDISYAKNVSKSTIKKTLPSFDSQKMLTEDNLNLDGNTPFRFGKGFDMNIKLSDGEWVDIPEGRLWAMGFYSKDAYSLNFVLNDFHLAEGAKLYMVNKNGTMLYGPVTANNNPKNGYFMTDLVLGDYITVYLFEPLDEKEASTMTIKSVVHAYKNVLPIVNAGYGQSLGCNNDISCFPTWDPESDAVGLVLLAGGTAWCSGSLIMTADRSFKPYFLSAFHCIDTSVPMGQLSASEITNAENWMFKFQYKKTTCNGSSYNYGTTYNGADFKAGKDVSDFVLMEMGESPAGNLELSWLGWDKSGNLPTSATNIHHPQGDVMKISFDNNNLTTNNNQINWSNGTTSAANTHLVANLDNGTAEGGSSGSPLLNQNKRVVGQLHGGTNGCAPITKYYGRFNLSWAGGGTNATRLSNWLDPCGSGATTTNTTRSPSITGPYALCSISTSYTVTNLPVGATISWNHSNFMTRTSPQGANPGIFAPTSGGNGWIEAVVTMPGGCGNPAIIRKNVLVEPGVELTVPNGPDSSGGLHASVAYGVGPYKWYKNSTLLQTTSTPDVYLQFGCSPGLLKVTCTSSCGPPAEATRTIYQGCAGGYLLSVYPNPSNSEIFIANASNIILEKGSKDSPPNAIENNSLEVELYDFSGNLLTKKHFQKSGSLPSVDVSGLKKGAYFLRIMGMGIDEVHQIIIK